LAWKALECPITNHAKKGALKMFEGESISFTRFQNQQWLVANDPKWITT
jgi:hypothetical protein